MHISTKSDLMFESLTKDDKISAVIGVDAIMFDGQAVIQMP